MEFTIRCAAGRAGERAIFASGVFDSQIGKIIPVNYRETEDKPVIAQVNEARLVRADILEKGKIAELTFETVDHDDIVKRAVQSPMSFGLKVNEQ